MLERREGMRGTEDSRIGGTRGTRGTEGRSVRSVEMGETIEGSMTGGTAEGPIASDPRVAGSKELSVATKGTIEVRSSAHRCERDMMLCKSLDHCPFLSRCCQLSNRS